MTRPIIYGELAPWFYLLTPRAEARMSAEQARWP
jgi:hypothetical protein